MPIASSVIFNVFLAVFLLTSCKERSASSVKDIYVLDELESLCKNYATQISPLQRSFAKHILSAVGLAEPIATTNCSNFASKLKTHTEVRLGTSDRSIEDVGALKYFTNFQKVSIELRSPLFGIDEIGHRNLQELYLDWGSVNKFV